MRQIEKRIRAIEDRLRPPERRIFIFNDGEGNQGVDIEALAEARALAGENVVLVSWLEPREIIS
jgi:hypothetical protein